MNQIFYANRLFKPQKYKVQKHKMHDGWHNLVDAKMRNEEKCVVSLSPEDVTIIQMSLLGEKECHMKLCDGARRAGNNQLSDSLRYYSQIVLPSLSTIVPGHALMSTSQLIGAWFAVRRFDAFVAKPHRKAQKENPVAFAMTEDFGSAIAPTKPLLEKLAIALSSCDQRGAAAEEGEEENVAVVAVVVTPTADKQEEVDRKEEEEQQLSQQPRAEEDVAEIAEALRRLRNSTATQ